MEIKKIAKSENETKQLGEIIGRLAIEGMVFTMTGDLGAGKTTMTKGIAHGLEIKKTITSPTFTICKIYQGRLPLYHFDAYRLEHGHEELGFEEMMDGDGVAVVEWPEYVKELLYMNCMEICIAHVSDEREITITWNDKKYSEIAKELKEW